MFRKQFRCHFELFSSLLRLAAVWVSAQMSWISGDDQLTYPFYNYVRILSFRTTVNEMDFKFTLSSHVQRCRVSFFNTCMKKFFWFWPINVKISYSTRTILPVVAWESHFMYYTWNKETKTGCAFQSWQSCSVYYR